MGEYHIAAIKCVNSRYTHLYGTPRSYIVKGNADLDPASRRIRAKQVGVLMRHFRGRYAPVGKKAHLSQEDLLDLMGQVDPVFLGTYDRSTVSKWENGIVLPNKHRLEVFGKALNLSADEIRELVRLADLEPKAEDGRIRRDQELEGYLSARQGVSSGSSGVEEVADGGGDGLPPYAGGGMRFSAAGFLSPGSFVAGVICVLASIAIALSLLAGTGRLAFSGDSFVFSVGNKTAMKADFGAEVQDVWLSPDNVSVGESADIKARFRNRSSSSGPYGGEATFDVTIAVYPLSGSGVRFHWNDAVLSYNQVVTYQQLQYKFDQAGTYTIYAEVYSNKGKENGWVSVDRFARLTETFIITNSSAGTPLDSALAGHEASALKVGR